MEIRNWSINGIYREHTIFIIDPLKITFRNALQGKTGSVFGAISREKTAFVEFACEFKLDLSLSLGVGSPGMNAKTVKLENQLADLELQISLYTDNSFTKVAPGGMRIRVPKPVHIGVFSRNVHKKYFNQISPNLFDLDMPRMIYNELS